MPAEQSCAWRGACGLAGEERDHIYYIPPDPDRTRTSEYSRDILQTLSFTIFITFSLTNELSIDMPDNIKVQGEQFVRSVRLTPLLSLRADVSSRAPGGPGATFHSPPANSNKTDQPRARAARWRNVTL